MRKIVFAAIVTSLFLISCSPILSTVYGLNKQRFFESKEALVDYYHGKLDLDKERLYFFNSNQQREDFMVNELAKLDNIMFYGLHMSDSTKVDDATAGDKSCIGVVDKFILNYDKEKLIHSNISNYTVYDIKGKPLNLNISEPTVVFVVDAAFGRLSKKDTNYIVKHIKEQSKPMNYVYISTDYYQQMEKVAQK